MLSAFGSRWKEQGRKAVGRWREGGAEVTSKWMKVQPRQREHRDASDRREHQKDKYRKKGGNPGEGRRDGP